MRRERAARYTGPDQERIRSEMEVEQEDAERTSFIDSDGNINLDNWPVATNGQCPQCDGYGRDYIPGRLFGLQTCPKCEGSGRCS